MSSLAVELVWAQPLLVQQLALDVHKFHNERLLLKQRLHSTDRV